MAKHPKKRTIRDGDFEMGFVGIDGSRNDIDKVSGLRDLCRLRYSQLMGSPCVIDTNPAGSSSGKCAVEHQAETEFCEMEHVYYQFTLKNPFYAPANYRDMIDKLVKALYAYHQYAGLRPVFGHAFKWPPESCLGEAVLEEDEVKELLLKAAQEAREYLLGRGYTKVDRQLVLDCTNPKSKGRYDWVSAEPII